MTGMSDELKMQLESFKALQRRMKEIKSFVLEEGGVVFIQGHESEYVLLSHMLEGCLDSKALNVSPAGLGKATQQDLDRIHSGGNHFKLKEQTRCIGVIIPRARFDRDDNLQSLASLGLKEYETTVILSNIEVYDYAVDELGYSHEQAIEFAFGDYLEEDYLKALKAITPPSGPAQNQSAPSPGVFSDAPHPG